MAHLKDGVCGNIVVHKKGFNRLLIFPALKAA
jgi:hypothetical protein